MMKREVRRRRGRNLVTKSAQVLKQVDSDTKSSLASVNKDWENWVIMHGNEKVAVEDVWGIGKVIGVKFNGSDENMFKVLSGEGRGRKPNSGVRGERHGEAGEGC
jgi:hypothetical protein